MQAGILDQEEPKIDKKTILRKEKAKKRKKEKRKLVNVRKVEEGETVRKVIVKIRLERIDMQKEITEEALLKSEVIRLIISLEFV